MDPDLHLDSLRGGRHGALDMPPSKKEKTVGWPQHDLPAVLGALIFFIMVVVLMYGWREGARERKGRTERKARLAARRKREEATEDTWREREKEKEQKRQAEHAEKQEQVKEWLQREVERGEVERAKDRRTTRWEEDETSLWWAIADLLTQRGVTVKARTEVQKRTYILIDFLKEANALADALHMEEGEEEEKEGEGEHLRLDLVKGPRTAAQRKVENARDDVLAGHDMVLAALGLHLQQARKVRKLVASLTAKEEEEKKKEKKAKEIAPPFNFIGTAAGGEPSPPLRHATRGQERGREAHAPSLQQARGSPSLLVLPEEQPACPPDSPRFLPPPLLVPHPAANLDEQQPQLDEHEEEEGEEEGNESEEECDEWEKDKKGDVIEKVTKVGEEEGEEWEGEEEEEEEEEQGGHLSPNEEARLRVQILNSLTRVVHCMINAPTPQQLEAILAHFKRGKKLRGICKYFELTTPLLRLLRKHVKGTKWRIPGQEADVSIVEAAALDRLEKMYLALDQQDKQPCGHLFLCTPTLIAARGGKSSSAAMSYEFLGEKGLGDWKAVALSQPDGRLMAAADSKGHLWIKEGRRVYKEWVDGSGGEAWRLLAIGNDGMSILAAANNGGKVIISTRRGDEICPREWYQVASSSEALKWVGAVAWKDVFVLVEEQGGVYRCIKERGTWKLWFQPIAQLLLDEKQKVKTVSVSASPPGIKKGGLLLATVTTVLDSVLSAGVLVSSDGGFVWERVPYCLPPLSNFPVDWQRRWQRTYHEVKPAASALSSDGKFGVVACLSGHLCLSCDRARQWDLLMPPQGLSSTTGWASVQFLEGDLGNEPPRILLLEHDGGVWLSNPMPLRVTRLPIALGWERVMDEVPRAPWVASAAARDASVVLLATRGTAALRHITGFRAGVTDALFREEKLKGKTRAKDKGGMESAVEDAAEASELLRL